MNNLWEILYDSLWTVQNGLNKPSWESIRSNDMTTNKMIGYFTMKPIFFGPARRFRR